MTAVFDRDGHEIGDMPLTEKQQNLLASGEELVVVYHTPQLLRTLIGERNGSFVLQKLSERITCERADDMRAYVNLQRTIQKAREAG